MTLDLQILADNREALLLAEVAALLHDWQKCIDKKVASDWEKNPRLSNKQKTWRSRTPSPSPGDFAEVLSAKVLTCGSIDLKTLCEEGRNPSTASKHASPLVQLLGKCHDHAHVDKELGINEQEDEACDRISTAFGFEPIEPDNLLDNLLSKVKPLLQTQSRPVDRENLLSAIQEVFSNAWGDTRRPINEVTLWDWGYATGCLYKPLIAGCLLKLPSQQTWRILRINFDVPGLYARAIKIADLLGYQRVIDEACERIKKLIEEDYPLGNEVYRDTTGIYFTFPDLDLPPNLAQLICRRVEEVEMELAPRIAVTVGDGTTAKEQLKSILSKARKEALEALAQPFDSQNLSTCWKQQWKTVGQGNWELCPVCRLRPKKEDEQVCQTCSERRVPRIQGWIKNLSTTIWLDEVANNTGRLALIIGHFGLDGWLSGDLVQTMLVKSAANNPGGCQPKNPSPARLRRIWETTRTFWQEVLPTEAEREIKQSLVGQCVEWPKLRLAITPRNGVPHSVITHHTYDLIINGVAVSVVWDGKHFLTCHNLEYLAKPEQLGQPLSACLVQGKAYDLEEPSGYGARNRRLGQITIQQVTQIDQSYLPAIPILAEPRVFMAPVPADRALKIVQAIKCKYEREMGKVRNRLPLYLGIVFAPRRTPLRALLDAGHSMTQYPFTTGIWTVGSLERRDCLPNGWPRRVSLTLSNCHGRSLRVEVPTVMGDGETKDLWYPYWQLKNGNRNDRQRRFTGADGATWVHVCDLVPGDQVHFMPSIFDFEFLDTTARRFEIHYNEHGQRPYRTRPCYLEDLDRLETLWGYMQHLSTTQRHQVIRTIEATREAWYGQDQSGTSLTDGVFRQFVADTLAGAEWPRHASWHQFSEEWRKYLVQAGVRGELADLLELHMEILKED
ncbi:CRISPR-associated protein Csx11 [Chloroflexus sp.]|uniref:CRISPR-associated protein Csx11 n=1 Tax=Chloroflexus sp. TaxID=1904827 RepID=UPI002ADD4F79|nr:CRISPR-associated protein Csx11 [Chloroflexus sp.]